MEYKHNSQTENFKIILVNAHLSKCLVQNSPPISVTCTQSTSFQSGHSEQQERRVLTGRDLANTSSDKWSRLITTVLSHVFNRYHGSMLNESWFPSMVFLPQSHKPYLVMRKPTEKNGRHSTKYLPNNSQNCVSLQKQGKFHKFSVQRSLENMLNKCNVGSYTGSWDRKRTFRKK